MIYVVVDVKSNDWDDKDEVKLLMVAEDPKYVISLIGTMTKLRRDSVFVCEMGSQAMPLNVEISCNLMSLDNALSAQDFLAQYAGTKPKKSM